MFFILIFHTVLQQKESMEHAVHRRKKPAQVKAGSTGNRRIRREGWNTTIQMFKKTVPVTKRKKPQTKYITGDSS